LTVRVATFNVHHGAPRRGAVDLDATIDACRLLDADVLAVQELDVGASRSGGVDQPAAIAEALAMQVVFAPTVALRGGGHYGHALLSRRPMRDVEVLPLAAARGREPRVAIIAVTSVEERSRRSPKGEPERSDRDHRQVSIASTHLQNERRGDPQPPLAIQQLTETLTTLGTRPGPRLVLGDMNLEDDVVVPVFETAGLFAVPTTPTFPSDRPSSTPDHVAVHGVSVEAASVPSTTVSDHRPLVVELSAVELS
jgi:endonuclease/exonuclease/phosphatase family metal-dependent hydrolase